ncbi:hypothetical protein DSCW_30800 [Desulfosarcina widdelii]|uniref:J domain-containing protein n=1 Tax=Desulfosarcina widdelii TaxID=947919 RepID=A0A5K7Z712_9BACT|nr:J domain-containing protein [Desulfosarcina widdelii]BBO75663.1 hypothetical protein DSCW_30800 [Desulfosarcina widdelii]
MIAHRQMQLLTRFVRQVQNRLDTPSLIVMIAANDHYLRLCQTIVNPAAASSPFSREIIERVCRNHGWRLRDLQERLAPAARALGIASANGGSADYYRILGIRETASPREIKQAYRSRALHLHPDTSRDTKDSVRRFQELHDAYQTLRDPALRDVYDAGRRQRSRWHEHPMRFLSADGRATLYLWYVGGLLVVFIVLFFALDAISAS